MTTNYDVIVLGAGAMGSAAAYYLSKAGQQVLLLEQFEIDHRRGSSYGHSRIIRYVYDNPKYIKLMQAAYPLWMALQEAAGETLYYQTGGIDFGSSETPSLQETMNSLRTMEITHEVLTPDAANERFSQFHFAEDNLVVYQADSGLLAASRCVRAHIRLAKENDAVILDQTPVTGIDAQPNSVTVHTEHKSYSAAKLIITAGAWTNDHLAPLGLTLPLTPQRCQLAFFTPDDLADYDATDMPVFISHGEDTYGHIYGIPNHSNSGVKVAFHGGEPLQHVSDIDYTPDDSMIDGLRAFNQRHIPGIAESPLKEQRVCLYTTTPDTHFIIDKHPEYAHIVISAGFSGHGFKFSTLIGSILSDLAIKGTTEHDISLFNISRF